MVVRRPGLYRHRREVSHNSNERTPIVDTNDIVLGYEDQDEIHYGGLLHREGALIVLNTADEILLQESVEFGTHSFSAAGHCILNEKYRRTAIREGFEELGRRFPYFEIERIGKIQVNYGNHKKANHAFVEIYVTRTDLKVEDFKINAAEVKSIKYEPIDEVICMAKKETEEAREGTLAAPYFAIPFRKAFEDCGGEILKYAVESKTRPLI